MPESILWIAKFAQSAIQNANTYLACCPGGGASLLQRGMEQPYFSGSDAVLTVTLADSSMEQGESARRVSHTVTLLR